MVEFDKKTEESMDKNIEEHFAEIIHLFRLKGIMGKNMNVGENYVSFNFRLRKEFCKECGKVKE